MKISNKNFVFSIIIVFIFLATGSTMANPHGGGPHGGHPHGGYHPPPPPNNIHYHTASTTGVTIGGASGWDNFPATSAGGVNAFQPKVTWVGVPGPHPRPYYYDNYYYPGVPGVISSLDQININTSVANQSTIHDTYTPGQPPIVVQTEQKPAVLEQKGHAVPAGTFFFLQFPKDGKKVQYKIMITNKTQMIPSTYNINLGDYVDCRFTIEGSDYIAQSVQKL